MKYSYIFLAIAILSGCASAPSRPTSVAHDDYESTKAYISKLIQYEMHKNNVTGLSIALVDDQHIVWADGFGYADQEKKIPASAETLYRLGSISKLFTDTAAMQLEEQERLDIDQPVHNYLPDFSIKTRYPGSAEITLRQLMTHHSGLPRDHLKGFMTQNPAPFSGVVKDMREDYAAYPPGHIFYYSNLGITLLGDVIQKQSGMPFAEYMQQSVLAPLSMTHSSFDTGFSPSALMSKGYQEGKAATDPALRDVPAGGLNSSVNDMSRFMSMIFAGGTSGNHRILKSETIAEMLRPQNSAVPLDFNFRIGLGWMLGKASVENAGLVAHHGGDTILFHSQMYILPEHKLGVVVLSNSSTSIQMVDHIATEALTLALEAKDDIRLLKRSEIPPDNRPLLPETMQEYVGDYATIMGLMQIRACGKGLCAIAAGHRFDLVRGSDGMFRPNYSLLGIFHMDLGALGEIGFSRRTLAGRDLVVARVGEQEKLIGQRITPPSISSAWRQYLGDYEYVNLDTDFQFIRHIRLIEKDGYLLIELTPADKQLSIAGCIPLLPVSDNEGILLEQLSDAGETVRSVTVDGEKRILISGYQFRRIAR